MPKICVDQNKCIACGSCQALFPEIFEAGQQGKSQVKDQNFKKHGYTKDELVAVCPVQAISVAD